MSVTTTENPITRTSLSVLSDYELHHSGSNNQEDSSSRTDTSPPTSASSQPNWPTHHRRVPAYRPTNYNLDFGERTAGTNWAEFGFIQVMLHGVWLNASAARLWGHTGGKINKRVFRYDVGGEW